MIDLLIDDKPVLHGVELILLDKDGTLIDIHHYWGSMIKKRAELLTDYWFKDQADQYHITDRLVDGMGIDLTTGLIKLSGPVGIKPRPFIVQVVYNIISESNGTVTVEAVEEIFREVDRITTRDILPYLKILPYVIDILTVCQKLGIKLAVVSTDITKRIILAMETLGLSEYFSCFVGGDVVNSSKPAPDPAQYAMDLCGVSAERTASIGDHPVDICMSLAAGISCNIGLLTGLGQRHDFESLPCHTIESLGQIRLQPNN